MKKSIKYAGIAAATLLAVAPVAAPVVSQAADTNTNQQAGESDVTPDATILTNALKGFTDNFGDNDAVDYTNASNIKLGSENQMTYADFMKSASAQALAIKDTALTAGTGKANLADAANNNAITSQTVNYDSVLNADGSIPDGGAGVTTTARQANVRAIYVTADHNLTTTHDLVNYLNDNKKPEVTFTLHYTYTDTANNTVSNQTKEFKATRTDDDSLTTVNAKYTTPYNVALNQTVTDTQLINATDFSIVDQNGKGVSVGDATPSADYFYTYSDALSGKNAIDDSSVISASSNVKKFKKAGTYYQAITVDAADNSALQSFIKDYSTDPSVNKILVNGKDASTGVDFTVNSATEATKDDEGNAVAAKPDSVTFVRAINVSDDASQWTTTDTTGVVTTKTDHNYYTLKNDSNKDVTNRALAKNTAWKTNAVRVDQNGNKQYRVGASEWIDANNVTFSDKATDNNNGEGAYTDVKALNGKVVTAGPSGFYYPLYNDNGKMISDRGVAGLSAWYTDKSAVNADGVTVYHVATGEWLQGTNATYTAY